MLGKQRICFMLNGKLITQIARCGLICGRHGADVGVDLSVRNNRKQKLTPVVSGGGLLSLLHLEQGSHGFVFDLIS